MQRPKGVTCHQCAPKALRRTPNLTGDPEFDNSVMHNNNSDMIARFKHHIATPHVAYGPVTNYDGYRNYHGDD